MTYNTKTPLSQASFQQVVLPFDVRVVSQNVLADFNSWYFAGHRLTLFNCNCTCVFTEAKDSLAALKSNALQLPHDSALKELQCIV